MKLTPDILRQIGFRGEGQGITGRPLYRYKIFIHTLKVIGIRILMKRN